MLCQMFRYLENYSRTRDPAVHSATSSPHRPHRPPCSAPL
jgi:hypothetical protein